MMIMKVTFHQTIGKLCPLLNAQLLFTPVHELPK